MAEREKEELTQNEAEDDIAAIPSEVLESLTETEKDFLKGWHDVMTDNTLSLEEYRESLKSDE